MNLKSWIQWITKIVVAATIAFWLKLEPLMQLLIILIAFDIMTGLIRSTVQKKLSSDVSWRGMGKKAIMLIVVAAAQFAGDLGGIQMGENLSLGSLTAGFYAVGEFLSMLENGAAIGMPVPKFLKDALQTISPEKFDEGSGGFPPAVG